MTAPATADTPLLQTPLHALHQELGARMVPFAGYAMPVQYPAGILAEHRQCRAAAALFDVSHMGQIVLRGDGAAAALERVLPQDIAGLGDGRQRYAFFTAEDGGLLDDLMVTRRGEELFLVVNAGCKHQDLALLQREIGAACTIEPQFERALLALQGPQAVTALARLNGDVTALRFMTGGHFTLQTAGGTIDVFLTRSGYTGEDGFEISVAADQAEALARALLAQPEVAPAGLGARDTLRLEAGLCLYGHDIDTTTSPVEAGLAWAIQKVRHPGGERAGGYPGAARIGAELTDGPARRRVGLKGLDKAPVREGTTLVDADGTAIGRVTSGTLGPTVQQPVALAYVPAALAEVGTALQAEVRGRRLPMVVATLPFAPHRYHR
jgi:aminomethyltransferase